MRREIEGGLVAVEQSGIFHGTVMVHLAPMVIEKAVNPRGAKRQIQSAGLGLQTATFPAHRVKNLSRHVQGVIMEFDREARRSIEQPLVHAANFGPAALDAADRIVHGDVVEGRPILPHEHDVAGVKCAIKLRECVARVGEIAKIFEAGDGIERGGKSG